MIVTGILQPMVVTVVLILFVPLRFAMARYPMFFDKLLSPNIWNDGDENGLLIPKNPEETFLLAPEKSPLQQKITRFFGIVLMLLGIIGTWVSLSQ